MAFVKIAKALKFPRVIGANPRIGQLWRSIKNRAAFTRTAPATTNQFGPRGQANLDTVPNTPPLRPSGRKI